MFSTSKNFVCVADIEKKYEFDFSGITYDSTFVIDLFNGKEKNFSKSNINQCLILLYYYLTFDDNNVFTKLYNEILNDNFIDNYGGQIVFRRHKEVIRLRIKYLKKVKDYKVLIETCERGIELYCDLICMKELYTYFKGKNSDMYVKYRGMYLKCGGGNNYDLYLFYKEISCNDEMVDALIDGIKNNEKKCFDELLLLYETNERKLKWIYMKIGNIKNSVIEENLIFIVERINSYDKNFFDNIIKEKKAKEEIFKSNTTNYIIGFIGVIIVLKLLFR